MKRIDLVFRSVGERTADESLRLAIENIQPDNVYQIENVRPFSVAVENMLAIDHDADYVVYVDADCLILENIRPFLEFTDVGFVDCLVTDYFRGIVRAGVHVTRIDLVNAMKENAPLVERNRRFYLRPESAIRDYGLRQLNAKWKGITKRFNILHDWYQSYEDVFTKYITREFRDRADRLPQLDKSMKSWGDSADFSVARAGVTYARQRIGSDIPDQQLAKLIEGLPKLAVKQLRQMHLPEQGKLKLSDSDRRKRMEEYLASRLSRPKIFGIGLGRTEQQCLVRALAILGFDAAPYSKSDKLMKSFIEGTFDHSPLEFYDAVIDHVVVPHYKQLDRQYENAKFILTIRETNFWKNSIRFAWKNTDNANPANKNNSSIRSRYKHELQNRIYGAPNFDEDAVLQIYHKHYNNVTSYFRDRPEDLLVINISAGDGWVKLCEFLNVQVPNEVFPYARRRESVYMYWIRKIAKTLLFRNTSKSALP